MATITNKRSRFTTFKKELDVLYSNVVVDDKKSISLRLKRPEWVWLFIDRTTDTYLKYVTWLAINSLKNGELLSPDTLDVDNAYLIGWLNSNTNRRVHCQRYLDMTGDIKEPITFEDIIRGGFYSHYMDVYQETKNTILNRVNQVNYVEEKELP